MATPVTKLDEVGMIFDRKPFTLPPNAWSDARNVRFIDGSVYTGFGHQAVLGVPPIVPYYLHSTLSTAYSPIFALPGLTSIYATDGGVYFDITRTVGGAYAASADDRWNAFDLGSISVFNNGIDIPQAWIGRALGTPLVDLANWPSTYRAKVMRTFKRHLFAMNITISGANDSTLFKWSHPADPGAVPVTWDPADTTKDAGEYPLIDTTGAIVDGAPLGEIFCIYKTDAIYQARYIGGTFVFDLPLAFRDVGLLAQDCMAEWQKKHVFLSSEHEFFMQDGFKYEPILKARMRRWLASRIDPSNAFRSFTVVNQAENEAWICFPETGNTFANLALIVNLHTGAAVPRDIPNLCHIEYDRGPVGGSTTFDSQTTPFDSMVGYFGQEINSQSKKVLLGVAPEAIRNRLLRSDELASTWSGGTITITDDVAASALTGLTTMERLDATVANVAHGIQQATVKPAAQETYNFSGVFKADGYNYVGLSIGNSVGPGVSLAFFDLLLGTASAPSTVGTFTGVQSGIEDLGGGQYRCWLSALSDANTALDVNVYVSNVPSLVAFAGTGTDGILAGNMQLRKGGDLGTYVATTTIAATSAIFLLDSTTRFDGVPFVAYAERIALSITGQDMARSLRVDPTKYNLFQQLWPSLQMLSGQTIQIQAGGQELADSGVSWNPAVDFDPSTDLFVDVNRECRYLAVRFQSSDGEHWRLTEYDVEVAQLGKFNG